MIVIKIYQRNRQPDIVLAITETKYVTGLMRPKATMYYNEHVFDTKDAAEEDFDRRVQRGF